ncbi:MAG: hypothetical protein ACYCSR_13295 [Thiomonas sp.]
MQRDSRVNTVHIGQKSYQAVAGTLVNSASARRLDAFLALPSSFPGWIFAQIVFDV